MAAKDSTKENRSKLEPRAPVLRREAIVFPRGHRSPWWVAVVSSMGMLTALSALTLLAATQTITRTRAPSISRMSMQCQPHCTWLGVQMAKGNGYVEVTAVVPGSPAGQAGIHKGDILFAVADRPVTHPVEVVAIVRAHRARDIVSLVIHRPTANGEINQHFIHTRLSQISGQRLHLLVTGVAGR